jgi:osmotically inducible protein OsmC
MALALALTRRGTPAERLAVSAVCALDRVEGEHEYAITGLRLEVRGHVPDIEGADFEALARHADEQCPVSNAVRGNVEVTLDARLDDAA